MDLKKDAAESVGNLVKGMAAESAFIAFLLIIVALLLGWFLYTNHMLQQQVIELRLLDYERETERFKLLDQWGGWLSQIKDQVKDMHRADSMYKEMLREIKNNPCK